MLLVTYRSLRGQRDGRTWCSTEVVEGSRKQRLGRCVRRRRGPVSLRLTWIWEAVGARVWRIEYVRCMVDNRLVPQGINK